MIRIKQSDIDAGDVGSDVEIQSNETIWIDTQNTYC